MQEKSEIAIRKRAVESLRQCVRGLESVGDFGTVAKLQPILKRLSERRVVDRTRQD